MSYEVNVNTYRFFRVIRLAAAALIVAVPAVTLASEAVKPGDAANGEIIYQECSLCHSIAENIVGPRHCGIVGRKSATIADFEYSEAMKKANLTWDEATLNKYLANPPALVPDTAMGFVGLAEEQARLDVIAYLKKAGDPKLCAK